MVPTIHQAAEAIRQGRLSPQELLEQCLAAIDRYEPSIHAWVFVDRQDARAEAERLARELGEGQWRGPLHGIPIGIKDIFDVFDWPTAAGSSLLANSIARRDATVVHRLRQAGAVFLGKTVTTQYASFDPSPTRNPWNRERSPAGSSSGSAAAIACGMCLGATASQTGGSITRPAAFCGVPGLKPTLGRVSVDGVVPLAPSLDHVGVMAGCVKDLAILLQTVAGADKRDPTASQRAVPDMLAAMQAPGKPPRLGRVGGLFDDLAEPLVKAVMEQVCGELQSRGGHVSRVALPAGFSDVVARHRIVMAVEAAAYHGPRLRRHPDDYQPKVRALLEEGLACPALEYAACMEHKGRLSREVLACFDGVDFLIAPSATGPASDLSTTGNPAFQAPWSYTGLPTVSLPAYWSNDDLPLCIQLVGPPWSEAELLAAAAWCEEALGLERREPTI